MAIFVALLRGINVGGSGLLPMKELSSMCSAAGFGGVRTYIQSGNVVFESGLAEGEIRSSLEPVLAARLGKPVDVMVRSAAEMHLVLAGNPFPGKDPAKVAVAFLHRRVAADLLQDLVAPGGEVVRAGRREIYTYYPDGMGRSKLKLPLKGEAATVRNINTVAKLVALAGESPE